MTLDELIIQLIICRDKYHVPGEAPVRFKVDDQTTIDLDTSTVTTIGDCSNAVVLESEDLRLIFALEKTAEEIMNNLELDQQEFFDE